MNFDEFSNGAGAIFFPPDVHYTFLLSVMVRQPPLSTIPISPVMKTIHHYQKLMVASLLL